MSEYLMDQFLFCAGNARAFSGVWGCRYNNGKLTVWADFDFREMEVGG